MNCGDIGKRKHSFQSTVGTNVNCILFIPTQNNARIKRYLYNGSVVVYKAILILYGKYIRYLFFFRNISFSGLNKQNECLHCNVSLV